MIAGCAACSDARPTPSSTVALGAWGGDHIAMAVSASAAHIELDCAHADIPTAIALDSDGRFSVAGTFVREHGGPIRIGEVPDAHPAAFSGSVSGNTMTLSIQLTDSKDMVGAFTLTAGASGRVVKCL